ncbi:MAG: hypothetical protein IME92_07770 [Proteobacteria bacterium]|nr:hypothetical protein [Pseudomonadota bacterium]
MKRVYKGFQKITVTTIPEVQSMCIGCDECTGSCWMLSDLVTIPDLVLHPKALPK